MNTDDSFAQNIIAQLDNVIYTRGLGLLEVDDLQDGSIVAIFDRHSVNDFNYRYNYWNEIQHSPILEHLNGLSIDKTIRVLTTEVETLKKFCNNVNPIHWYSDIAANYSSRGVMPMLNKNFRSSKICISLNRQMRVHRLALLSLLYGMNISDIFHISATKMSKQLEKIPSTDFMDHCDWMFDENQYAIRDLMIQGFTNVVNQFKNSVDATYEYIDNTETVNIDNASNFVNNLSNFYKNSFIEVISLTYFEEPADVLCEKYINSVFGCNFPIIIGSVGQVNSYRNLGFDLFDDIIDHSYDLIDNPIDRLYKAISLNKHIFNDNIKELWLENKHRFVKNIDFYSTQLFNKLTTDTLERINKTYE